MACVLLKNVTDTSPCAKKHESDNKKKHKIYRQSLEWADSFKPEKGQTSLLMIMAEESETRGEK